MTDTPITYNIGDSSVVMVQDPTDKNFSNIYGDTTSIYVPDAQQYVYRDKYSYTPGADEYNKYAAGIDALNDEIKNKYRGALAENEQYCHIAGAREIRLLSTATGSRRMDANMLTEDIYT
jgi:hypothetical protein